MKKTAAVVFGFLVVALGAALLVFVLWRLGSWFLGLPTATMTATGSLVGVLAVPIVTYFTSRSLEKGRARDNAVREQKTEFYDKTIRDLISMFGLGGQQKSSKPADMVSIFAKIPAPMITFASRGVIVAWNDFRRTAAVDSTDTRAMILAFEELLKQMRKDLGHQVTFHQAGELVGIFVNDADSFFGRQARAAKKAEELDREA